MQKTVDLEDYLTVDPPIANQQYCLITYLLPDPEKNEIKYPIIKNRGNFPTIAACNKRIEKLKKIDEGMFSITLSEVGKYMELLPPNTQKEGVETIHSDSRMNEAVKGHIDNNEKSKVAFSERVNFDKRKEQYIEEKIHSDEKEHPIAVKNRIEVCQMEIKRLHEQLQKQEELLKASEIKYLQFTEEELQAAEAEEAMNNQQNKPQQQLKRESLEDDLDIDDVFMKRSRRPE